MRLRVPYAKILEGKGQTKTKDKPKGKMTQEMERTTNQEMERTVNYSDDIDIDRFKICNNNIKVSKYASSFCSKADTADIIVNSTRQDADVGVIFATTSNALVIIITKDHFASCLSDIYKNCYHVQSIKHCVAKLNSFVF